MAIYLQYLSPCLFRLFRFFTQFGVRLPLHHSRYSTKTRWERDSWKHAQQFPAFPFLFPGIVDFACEEDGPPPSPCVFRRLQELSVPCRSAAVLLRQEPAAERIYSFMHIPSSSLRNICFTLLRKFLLMFPRRLKSLRPVQRLVTSALVTVKLLGNWVLSHTRKHWPVNNTGWEHSSVYSKASEKLLRLWLRESSRGRSV